MCTFIKEGAAHFEKKSILLYHILPLFEEKLHIKYWKKIHSQFVPVWRRTNFIARNDGFQCPPSAKNIRFDSYSAIQETTKIDYRLGVLCRL